jgi:hypothetical protein
LKDAVHKIFEGQPLNYLLIEGKGIRVTDAAQSAGGATSTASTSSPSFMDSPPINSPAIPIGNVQGVPVNAGGQPVQPNNPFGNQPPPAQPATATPAPAFVPGQLPPPIGASNPLVSPAPASTAPATGFPTTPAPVPQPAGPGAVPGTPGQITPGQIR